MLIRTSFPNFRAARLLPTDAASTGVASPQPPRPTLLQRLDRWLWSLEAKGRERYLAAAADRFDLERRVRHIDRAGAFWFG